MPLVTGNITNLLKIAFGQVYSTLVTDYTGQIKKLGSLLTDVDIADPIRRYVDQKTNLRITFKDGGSIIYDANTTRLEDTPTAIIKPSEDQVPIIRRISSITTDTQFLNALEYIAKSFANGTDATSSVNLIKELMGYKTQALHGDFFKDVMLGTDKKLPTGWTPIMNLNAGVKQASTVTTINGKKIFQFTGKDNILAQATDPFNWLNQLGIDLGMIQSKTNNIFDPFSNPMIMFVPLRYQARFTTIFKTTIAGSSTILADKSIEQYLKEQYNITVIYVMNTTIAGLPEIDNKFIICDERAINIGIVNPLEFATTLKYQGLPDGKPYIDISGFASYKIPVLIGYTSPYLVYPNLIIEYVMNTVA